MINREFTVYGNGKHFKNKILPTLSKFKSVKIKSIISRNKNQCIENSSIKNLCSLCLGLDTSLSLNQLDV